MRSFLQSISQVATVWLKFVIYGSLILIAVYWALRLILWAYLSYTLGYAPYRGKKFNSDEWMHAAREMVWGERCPMYNDLIKNHLKVGMSLEEVEAMLGKAIRTYFCAYKEVKCLHYLLGNCYAGLLGIVNESIDVCFDPNNTVLSVGKGSYAYKFCNYQVFSCASYEVHCLCYMYKNQMKPTKCPFELKKW